MDGEECRNWELPHYLAGQALAQGLAAGPPPLEAALEVVILLETAGPFLNRGAGAT